MDVALLHPSRFLKSQEFKGKDVTLTITGVHLEELEDEKNRKQNKGVVTFKETPKLLVINRTNSDCIKGMFGRETNNWIGKRVTLYPEPFFNNFTKEHTTAIRVRGSPDIQASTTVTIHLPRKKPTQVRMTKTGAAPTKDDLDAECAAIDEVLAAAETPEACDAAWNAGLGARINRLPPDLKNEKSNAFKKRRRELKAPAPTEPAEVTHFPKSDDPPPPGDDDAPF